MRLAGSALGVALVVFGPSCARADLVTYTASGLMDGASLPLQGQFIAGQPLSYTFTLNTATPNSDPSPTRGKYYNGVISSSGSIGSYQFSTGLGDIDVNTAFPGPGSTRIILNGLPVTGAAVGGIPLTMIAFDLEEGAGFTSDAIPTSLNLSAFAGHKKFNLLFTTPAGTIERGYRTRLDAD